MAIIKWAHRSNDKNTSKPLRCFLLFFSPGQCMMDFILHCGILWFKAVVCNKSYYTLGQHHNMLNSLYSTIAVFPSHFPAWLHLFWLSTTGISISTTTGPRAWKCVLPVTHLSWSLQYYQRILANKIASSWSLSELKAFIMKQNYIQLGVFSFSN